VATGVFWKYNLGSIDGKVRRKGIEYGKAGVTMAVENVWNKFLYSPMEFKRFIMDVGMRNVKVYLDVANLLAISYPENWIHSLGNMISNVHAKDFDISIGNINGFRNVLKGNVDWKKVFKLLEAAGYDGYLTVECPPSFNPSLKSPTVQDILKNAEENCRALEEIIKRF